MSALHSPDTDSPRMTLRQRAADLTKGLARAVRRTTPAEQVATPSSNSERDPTFAAAASYRAAWDALDAAVDASDDDDQIQPELRALTDAYRELRAVRPTTAAGFRALAETWAWRLRAELATPATGGDDAGSVGEHAADSLIAASGAFAPLDPVDWQSPPPGFMASPAMEPFGFVPIPDGIQIGLKHLHGIAMAEFQRRSQNAASFAGTPDTAEQIEHRRQRLRLDALAQAMALEPATDAALIALEAEFLAADAETSRAAAAEADAMDGQVSIDMPAALKVWGNDWFLPGIPQTGTVEVQGRLRSRPYGKQEVEMMRTATPMHRVFGTAGELQADGSRAAPDTQAQARIDTLVAAWDGWQAQKAAAREAVDLPALEMAFEAAREALDTILQRIRETPARGLAGLAIKARIAANMLCETDIRTSGLDRLHAGNGDAFLYDLAGDVVALTGGLPVAHRNED